jgi:hypothetical protein
MASISIPGAIIGAGALSAGAGVYSANQAANAQKNAAANATAAQLQMFNQTQANLNPFIQAGAGAIPYTNALLGIAPPSAPAGGATPTPTPGMLAAQAAGPHSHGLGTANLVWGIHDPFGKGASPIQDIAAALQQGRTITDAQWAQAGYGPGGSMPGQPAPQAQQAAPNPAAGWNPLQALQNIPGYQFIRDQGLKSTQNSYAAQGLGSSGAAMRGAADYSENLANSYYQNFFNNLMAQQQLGANAAAGLGGYATQTGANIGANLIGAGNAQGASAIAQGNAIGGFGNSLVSAALYNRFYPNTAAGAAGTAGGLGTITNDLGQSVWGV